MPPKPRPPAGAKRRAPLDVPQRVIERIDRPKRLANPFAPAAGLHPFAAPEIVGDAASITSSSIGGPSLSAGWGSMSGWAFSQFEMSAYAEGQVFMGFPMLAIMSQRAEYQNIVKTIAVRPRAKTAIWLRALSSSLRSI